MRVCLAATVLLGAPLARAESFDTWGELRARHQHLSNFDVDALGTQHGQEAALLTRLRAGAFYQPIEALRLTVEAEALSGVAAGDLTDLGLAVGDDTHRRRRDVTFGTTEARLRQAWLRYDTPVGRLMLGQQSFLWGTGMLAHDGATAPDFGDAQQGNLVYRAAFATQPDTTTRVFVAGDLVASDDNADYTLGDRAYGAAVGLRWDPSPRLGAGLLTSWRAQTDREDPRRPGDARSRVDVLTGDLYLKWQASSDLTLESETAITAGTTTRPYLEETRGERSDVRALGALLRAAHERADWRLTTKLDVGFASGDNDPRDADAHAFSFNSDFGAGLVLFDHVLPLMTARAADRVVDPTLLDRAPAGLRFTVNQGAVTNAVFVHPRVVWRPRDFLDLRAGWMPAWAPADVADVYASARAGGFNTTPGGRSGGGRFYGQELEAAARARVGLVGSLVAQAGVEAGVFLPGSVFDGVDLGTVSVVRGMAEVTW